MMDLEDDYGPCEDCEAYEDEGIDACESCPFNPAERDPLDD